MPCMSFLVNLLDNIFRLFTYMIIARVILSWLPDLQRSRAAIFLDNMTEPLLGPLRRILPPMQGLDLSPLLALILLQAIERILVSVLLGAGL